MDLQEILGEELYNQVKEKLGDTKIDIVNNGKWIPLEKFNDLNTDLKELKNQISARDKQLKELESSSADNQNLKTKLEELRAENKKIQEEYEGKIKQRDFNFALDNELSKHNPKNLKALKSLLEIEGKVALGEDGKLMGLEEQLKALKESDGYLFGTSLKGQEPNLGGQSGTGKNPFSKENFNLTEQGKLFRENPNLAKQYMAEANQQ